jgi:hypothetical protein
MACKPCNTGKGDLLPSEWRGENLSPLVKAIEARICASIEVRARAKRGPKPSMLHIAGYTLLRNKMAVCLDYDQQQCHRPAEWEVRSPIDGVWGAYCARCVRYWSADLRRELDERRGVVHVLVQLRDGTLDVKREIAICALARTGGVSVEEYLDFALQMITGETVVRDGLKASLPALRLEMWEPA